MTSVRPMNKRTAMIAVCHGGQRNGQTLAHGGALGGHRALSAAPQAASPRRSANGSQSPSPHGYLVRLENRRSLGGPTSRNGLWVWNDLLEETPRLAGGWRLAGHSARVPQPSATSRSARLVTRGGGQFQRPRRFWGDKTGPNPTDRRKNGSKHHVLTDANGIPLAATVTGANRHDVTQLLPLVDAIPPISGKRGRPRKRPQRVQGDRAYHSAAHAEALRQRGIEPVIAQRNTDHGSGLGVTRWVVERTNAWLHQFRRLRVRYERRADIHEAFLILGCIVICSRTLQGTFC